jgi:hypothetical protein
MALGELLGRWEPLDLRATVGLFSDAWMRWWITGGRALELHLGRSWRDHDDADVSVARGDIVELRAVLHGWDIHVAAAGHLERWRGETLVSELHQNNLWCRPSPGDGWRLDVTVSEGDAVDWIYRRDRRVRVPWDEAVLRSPDGIPYLAPDLQLLFKSREPRPKDDLDARTVIPEIDADRQGRLRSLLPASHPWQDLISSPT